MVHNMCEETKRNIFQTGDIVVETLDNTPIGKYIITSIEMNDKKKDKSKLDYSLYVLWTNGHWPESQGSIFVITNLHNMTNRPDTFGDPYIWKKLDN